MHPGRGGRGDFRSICIMLKDIKEKLRYTGNIMPNEFQVGEAEVIKMRFKEVLDSMEDLKKMIEVCG